MTRLIELKELVQGTYYRPTGEVRAEQTLVEVEEGIEFNPVTMIRQVFSYQSTLMSMLRSPRSRDEPMDYEDMQRRVDVIREVKKYKDGETFELDDDLYSKLTQVVKAARWIIATEQAVQFVEDIIHAKAIAKEKSKKAETDTSIETNSITENEPELMPTMPTMLPIRQRIPIGAHKGKNGRR